MKLSVTASTRRTPMKDVADVPPSAVVEKRAPRDSRRPHRVPSTRMRASVTDTKPPKDGKRKERNALETKRRILEAAASEFAAKGFDGARLGSIARAAGVQQALIHHYFADKEGLHQEVVRGGLAAMTEGVWDILARMDAPETKKRKRTPKELRALATAFVELLVKFFATNGSFLQILRHEARRGDTATKIVADNVGPIFEGIAARLDAMRAKGEVRADVDAKHLVLSAVAMVAFPFQEEPFVAAIWPGDWHAPKALEERTRHVVDMILARVLP
jgi:TetR/AcrR family transcriptional regulator